MFCCNTYDWIIPMTGVIHLNWFPPTYTSFCQAVKLGLVGFPGKLSSLSFLQGKHTYINTAQCCENIWECDNAAWGGHWGDSASLLHLTTPSYPALAGCKTVMSVHSSGFRDILQAAPRSFKGLCTATKTNSTLKTKSFPVSYLFTMRDREGHWLKPLYMTVCPWKSCSKVLCLWVCELCIDVKGNLCSCAETECRYLTILQQERVE